MYSLKSQLDTTVEWYFRLFSLVYPIRTPPKKTFGDAILSSVVRREKACVLVPAMAPAGAGIRE